MRDKYISKILVVTLSNLGDVILTLPVFQCLSGAFPEAKLHVLAGAGATEVFKNDGRIQKLIPYDKKIGWQVKLRLIQKIREERYDLIVDLRRSAIGLLGGARHRNSYFSFLNKNKHRAERHLSALKGIVAKEVLLSVKNDGWLPGPQQEISGERLVVAAVGSKSDIKKWPAEYYARLLDKLAVNERCRIALVGDKNDAADVRKIKNLMSSEAADFSGRTNFQELLGLIQKASLVITNDSAPLHIADALKVPTLAIFGPTDPVKYGPRFASSAAVKKEIFCSPCENAQCRYHHECMRELGVDEVYSRAVRTLKEELHSPDLRVLVVRLDRIGDVVLSLPALQAIRNYFPDAHISVMTRPSTRSLLEGHPLLDETIPYFYEKKGRHSGVLGNFRFIREIVRRRFDIVFVLNPSLRSFLVPFCAGIPYRVGFKTWPLLLTHSAEDRRHEGSRHESEYTLDVVRAFGIKSLQKKSGILPVLADESRNVEKILKDLSCEQAERMLAIHAGASCISKRWPKERFAALGKRIAQNLPHRIVFIGGEEEKELGNYLKQEIGEAVLDLTGKLGLKELGALLQKCELLVSNDSGPAHIAAAVGTRTFAIFGRNRAGLSVARWKALGAGHAVIQKDVGCVVCLAHRCTIDFECLKAISVEEVYEKVLEILSYSATGPCLPDRQAAAER